MFKTVIDLKKCRKLILALTGLLCVCSSAFALKNESSIRVQNNTGKEAVKYYVIQEGKDAVEKTVNLPARKDEKKKNWFSKKAKDEEPEADLEQVKYYELLIKLNPGEKYAVVLEDASGMQYVKESIVLGKDGDSPVVEFTSSLKKNREYVSRYEQNLKEKREIAFQESRDLIIALVVIVFFLVVFLTGIIVSLARGGGAGFKKDFIGGGSTGFRVAEIIGVFIMIIPVVLSFLSYKYETGFWMFRHVENMEVRPFMLSMLGACIMYGSWILKYNLFKTGSYLQVVFSIFQTIVNCWVLATFITFFVGGNEWNIPFIHMSSQTFFVIVLLFSVFGARSIAGFMWIFLLVLCAAHLTEVNKSMGVTGAVLVLSSFIGFMLQFVNVVNVEDFKRDFLHASGKVKKNISADVNASVEVVENVVKTTADAVVTAATGVPAGAVKNVLSVNKAVSETASVNQEDEKAGADEEK